MAKAKGLMASGQTGKLDNVVYYKGANGDTIARKLVIPKNPNTLAQRYQRVIIKTVNKNYQVFKSLADHAFEGKTMGAQCMNRFMQLNARMLRSRAVELQMAGQSLAQLYSFMPLKSDHYTPAAIFISEGSLPQVPVTINPNCAFALGENTYAAICEKYGLRRGDQLTFCVVGCDEVTGENILRYARVILDPRNADGSGAAMSSPFIADGKINLPNFRNAGAFTDIMYDANEVVFNTVNGDSLAAGIIVSRKDSKGYWYRSSCKLVISEANMTDKVSLEEAATEYANDLDLINDDAYLNNAGVGGAQGEETEVIPTPSTPQYNMNATINGVSQSIASGNTTATAPLSSIRITGSNLEDVDAYVTVDGAGTIHPTTKSSSVLEWTGLTASAGQVVAVHTGASTLVTITVQAGGSGGSGNDEN